ncbi:MAG: stage III sporulation protein AB [Ruminococcus sp.]|nr:stage III sporulation protein AB [Ruminococcus sp.]
MFFRIVAAILFSVAGGIAGISFSERLKMELEMCRSIRDMFIHSAMLIRCRAIDVYSLGSELKRNGQLFRLTFLQKIPECYTQGDNFHEIWKNAVNSQKNLPSDEKKILCDFGEVLGRSDIEGQIVSINALEEMAVTLEKKRSESYSQKGKLYRSVGMLFGVMVGILVI